MKLSAAIALILSIFSSLLHYVQQKLNRKLPAAPIDDSDSESGKSDVVLINPDLGPGRNGFSRKLFKKTIFVVVAFSVKIFPFEIR